MSKISKTYFEAATQLFDDSIPNPVSLQKLTSTPLPKLARKFQRQHNLSHQVVQSEPSHDEECLWSVDSRPVEFAQSQVSNSVDFHHVEAVLPRNHLSNERAFVYKDGVYDDDELSDGAQSHTVYTIARLTSNLNAEKKKTKILQDKITYLENELSSANMRLEIELSSREEKESEKIACLVEEIYTAQRERESAVLARLKLAVQEKDEALLREKAFIKDSRYVSSNERNIHSVPDSDLAELLSAVCEADSARTVEKYGRSILDHLVQLRHERDRITSEEMKLVMTERDEALHKYRALTEEMERLKRKLAKFEALSESKPVKADLLSAREDRDLALKKLTSVEEELETLRIYYSLHKSLVEHRDWKFTEAEQDDATRLADTLRVAQEHNKVQEMNTQRHEATIRRLTDKNERLERLVTVLRRKLTHMAHKSSSPSTSSKYPSSVQLVT